MIGFALLLGHLVGDYLFQNDWMARNKTNPHPGEHPDAATEAEADAWCDKWDLWMDGHAACAVHCVLYTLAVFLLLLPLGVIAPWWFYAGVCALHWPVDRWRLAALWMRRVSGQKLFATGPLAPWSVIVVDNVAHLIVLYVLAILAGLHQTQGSVLTS